MSTRRGRPNILKPRNIIFKIRLNEDEDNQLNNISKAFGMSKSEAIRLLIRTWNKL